MRSLILALGLLMMALVPTYADEPVRGLEHFIEANGMRLRIWEKASGAPEDKPVVLVAHGSATAGQESFDLQVPGKPDYSLMDALARAGFDVFAPDIRGFGRSTKPESGVTTGEAQTDLDAVIDFAMKLRGAAKVSLVAWSWGTQYAGLEVAAHPEKIRRYVSYAQMHAASPDIVKRRERLEEFRSSPYLAIPRDGWKKRFLSMTPESVNDPDVMETYAAAASSIELRSPTGPHIDMVTRLPMVDAARITVPTLLVHGALDDVADPAGLMPFFAAIANPDKAYVVVPDAGHMAHLQAGHRRLHAEIIHFLKR